MISIIHQPDELSPAGNPIAYELQTDNINTVFFGLQVYVETFFQSGVYELVQELTSPPDENLKTTFYLDEILKACLNYFEPDFTNNSAQFAPQLCKRYYVALSELKETDSFNTVIPTNQPAKYVMNAKFHRQLYPTRTNFLPKANLLFHNSTKKLGLSQKDFLGFIPYTDVSDFTLTLTINYTNLTTHVATLSFGAVSKYEPIFIPIGMVERDYNQYHPTRTIKDINISHPYGAVNLQFYPSKSYECEVMFYNELGGIESKIFAERIEEIKINQKQFQHYQPYNYTPLDREFKNYEKSVRKSGKLNSGLLDTCGLDSFAIDAITSPILYVKQKDGSYYPANNTTDQHLAFNNLQRVSSFEINYEYAYYE